MSTNYRIKAIKPFVLDAVKAKIGSRASDAQFKKAVKLVLDGTARYIGTDMIEVASQSESGKSYQLQQGAKTCTCYHAINHPEKICVHRIAACLLAACFMQSKTAPIINEPTFASKMAEQVVYSVAYNQYRAEGGELDYEGWLPTFIEWQAMQAFYQSNKADWTAEMETEISKLEKTLCL